MAQHETYSLGIDTNFDSVLKANKALNAMYEGLKKVDSRFSGMHVPRGLPAEINHIDTVTASYIRRLESEGKTYEANQQKVKAYKGAISELSNKQNELRSALDKAKDAASRNSDAYRTQRIRFNENVVEINRYKAGLRSVNEEMRKANPNFWDEVKSHLHSTNTEAEKTHSLFKTIFSANLVSNAVTGGFNFVRNNIGGMIRSAHEYNVQQQTMNATWLTLTGNAHKGKAMVDQIDSMAAAAQNDTKMVDTLSQKFYAINKSPQQTAQITKSVLTLQDAFGATDASVENFGTQFSQMMANQKVSAQDMMSFVNVFPEYRTQLLKTVDKQQHTKLSMKQMNAEMSKGKISSKVAIDALENMAHHYKNATGNFTKTIPGMIRTVKSQMPRLASAFDKPFTKVENPILKQVSDWSTSNKTKRAFNYLGSVISHGMNRVMSTAFGSGGRRQTTVGQLLNSGIYKAAGAFKKLFGYLAIHGKDIMAIGKSLFSIAGTIGKGVWKNFSAIAINIGKAFGLVGKNADKNGGTLHALAQGLNNLSKNKTALKAISDYIVIVASAKGVKNVTGPLIDLGTKGAHTFQAVRGISRGLRGITDAKKIQKMGKLETHFFNIGKGARDAAKAVGTFGSKIARGLSKGSKGLVKAVKAISGKAMQAGKFLGRKITAGIKATTKFSMGKRLATGALAGAAVATPEIINAVKDRHSAGKRSQDIGGAVGALAGGTLTSMIPVVGPLLAPVGAIIGKYAGRWGGQAVNNFTKGWQRKKPPKKFWSLENLGWSTHSMFKGIGKGWNSFWGGMGDWRKKEARAMGRWSSQTGKSIKKGFNGAKTFVKNIPSNLDKTGKSIKKWADTTGRNIHKGWNKGITASHKFFVNLPKNIDKTKKNIGKWTSKTGKDIGSAWRKGQKATVSFVKHIPSNLGKAQKSVERWGRKTGKNIGSAWHKGTTAVGKFVSSIPGHLAKAQKSVGRWAGRTGKSIHSAWDKGKQGLTSFVTSIPRMLGKAYSAVIDWAGKVGKTVKNAWNGFWGKAGDIRKGVTNNVKAFGNDLAFASGHSKHTFKYEKIKSHASGGRITASHHALVGEAGPELAYKRGSNARLLGARGPQITRVHAGEHILNARDTAKVLSGGLGAGVTLKGYAGGTDKLKKTSKSVTKDYKDIASKSTKSLKKLTRSNKKAFKQVNTDANKQTKQTKTRTVANFKQMHHGITKQMDAIHDGVIRSGKSTAKGFGGAMDKMHKYAHSAMADTTHQLNKGISSIDKVLGQFGGNNSVIKPIKFAKGTDQQGRLTHNTLAMVNDATYGPRQEALVSPDNKLYLPKGQNVQLMLPAGWGVLNGTQTKQVTNKTINHFAKGTGISHSALRKLAEKANADPSKWFKSTYSNDIKQHGSDLNKGTTALGSNSSTKYGNPWSNALWGVINKQIDSDDGGSINATGLLKAAEKYGEGHRYVWGATGPSTFDCSGLVMYTLKKAYGINYPHFSGSQYNMTRHISKAQAHMGDLVFWGAGGSDHVGIYAGGNKYFSAESPSQGIHMNTLDSVVGKGRPLFGRIKGMPAQKSKAKHVKKPDNRLTALVKRELGSRAIKWIKDNLGDDFGSLGSFSVGSDLKERARALAGGLKKLDPRATKAGIAAVLGNWNFESGGLNPSAVNSSGGASGLGQWLGGRLTNLKAYARRHGTSWKNAGTQLSFAVKGEDSDSAIFRSILEGHGSVASLANRFSAEWERGGYNAQHVRGAMQVAKALGFAKGGRPKVGQNVIVGENGPEIARFDSPVQIYSNEKSRRSLNLGKLPDVQHASTKKHFTDKFAPVININFNGSASDFDSKQARKIAEIVQRELEKVFNSIDEEFC